MMDEVESMLTLMLLAEHPIKALILENAAGVTEPFVQENQLHFATMQAVRLSMLLT